MPTPDQIESIPTKCRFHGKYYDGDGQPRGGGLRVPQFVTIILHKAILLSSRQVDLNNGLGENGQRTPWEELSPAVEPTRVKAQVVYRKSGKPKYVPIEQD